MRRQDKLWAILVHLSLNMWGEYHSPLSFDEDMWTYILQESTRIGLNTIVLDVGDGVQYKCHPEISVEGAWSAERVHAEITRCKELGIRLIPKLNFSATHHLWLGKYARMVSTDAYYQVVKDLIEEIYELFEQPEFIHIGMDEENYNLQSSRDFICFRQGELLWHDMNYLMDCVIAAGARPWIWACPLFDHTEEYLKHVEAKKAVISPWYYKALLEEHWSLVEDYPEYVEYYKQPRFAGMHLKYLEDDPFYANVRAKAIPLMEKGFDYIPCGSVYERFDCNHSDLLKYFRDRAPDDQILGYMSAPWVGTDKSEKSKQYFEETFRFMKEAMDESYPE